jgi:hypothetical protein
LFRTTDIDHARRRIRHNSSPQELAKDPVRFRLVRFRQDLIRFRLRFRRTRSRLRFPRVRFRIRFPKVLSVRILLENGKCRIATSRTSVFLRSR